MNEYVQMIGYLRLGSLLTTTVNKLLDNMLDLTALFIR